MIKFKVTDRAAWSDRPTEVACGQCIGCRLERSRQWAVRCMHEAQMHDANCFLTLTYDDDQIPDPPSLNVADWQRFAKRTRKRLGPFRFFHCGEYGDQTYRPHYHAAVFGLDFSEDRTEYRTTKAGNPLYNSPTLDDLWGHGFAVIGALTFDSAAYVARYCMKKVTGKKADSHYGVLKPEYTTMSRRPGIGKTWFDKYVDDVYPSDQVITNGHPARPPKFYDSQYELLQPEIFEALKAQRAAKARLTRGNNTPERLHAREIVTSAKVTQLTRTL